MSSGAGQNTVTSNSQPPAQFQSALTNVAQQAQQTGQTPYQQYPGQLVAGLSPDQQAGIAGVQSLQGISNPYINSAADYIGQSTTPLQPYIQPYIDQSSNLDNLSAANAANLPASAQPGINAANSLYAGSASVAGNITGNAQPGVTAANALYGASAQQLNPTQFSAGQVNQYESPYTQQVVNATQAEFNNQNQQQQQQVAGNAISQGAFGGDREAVAQGITAGQQQLAQAPVIAGLQNQGYSQALGEFNTQQQVGLGAQEATQQLQQGAGAGILSGNQQMIGAQTAEAQGLQAAGAGTLAGNSQLLGAEQAGIQGLQGAASGNLAAGQAGLGANEANAWLDSQAGFGMANLGNQAVNNGLQENNALLSTGGLEQAQAQSELNVPYEQYTAAQAYPFQTESWLSGLEGQLSNAAGGTASTTSPGPSPISQIGGLGLTGLAGYGLLNNAGLLGSSAATGAGTTAALSSGALAASSGISDAAGFGSLLGGAAEFGIKRGGTVPERALGGGIVKFPTHLARPGIGRGITAGANDNMHPMGMPKMLAAGGVAIPHLPTSGGGIVSVAPSGGGVSIPQLSGHAPAGGGVSDYLAKTAAGAYHPSAPPPPGPAGAAPSAPSPAAPSPGQGLAPWSNNPNVISLAGNDPGGGGPVNMSNGNMRRGGGILRRDDGGAIGDDQGMPVPPIPPDNPPPQSGGGIMGGGGPPPPPAQAGQGMAPMSGGAPAPSSTHVPWETLLAAGLNIMGGASPNAAVNIGRGGMQGLQWGEQQRAQEERQNLARITQQQTANYQTGELNLRGQQIQQTGDLTKAEMAQKQALEQAQMAQQMSIAKMHIGMEGANLAETRRYHDETLNQGKYTWSAGMGPDPTDPTKQTAGMYRLPTKGDEQPQFIAGQTLTTKQNGAQALPTDVTQMLAQRVMAGDNSALTGLGMGTAGAAARIAVQTEVTHQLAAQGHNGADLAAKTAEYMGEKAGARTAGTREANVGMAVNEAQNFIPMALDASAKVPRTQFPTLNSIQQAYEQHTGDENIVRLAVATNSLVNAYSRAITPSGIPTEGNQTRARELLDKAWSQGQYSAAVDQLNKEMQAAKLSPVQQQTEQSNRISGRSQPTSPTSAPTIPRISSPTDAAKLPSGSQFYDPNGVLRNVP